jgi:hypothetical protein
LLLVLASPAPAGREPARQLRTACASGPITLQQLVLIVQTQ